MEGVGHSGYLLPIDHVINSVARYYTGKSTVARKFAVQMLSLLRSKLEVDTLERVVRDVVGPVDAEALVRELKMMRRPVGNKRAAFRERVLADRLTAASSSTGVGVAATSDVAVAVGSGGGREAGSDSSAMCSPLTDGPSNAPVPTVSVGPESEGESEGCEGGRGTATLLGGARTRAAAPSPVPLLPPTSAAT